MNTQETKNAKPTKRRHTAVQSAVGDTKQRKSNAGRKSLPDGQRKVTLSGNVFPVVADEVQTLANDTGISAAEIVHQCVTAGLPVLRKRYRGVIAARKQVLTAVAEASAGKAQE